jgi:hypothetical protein
MKENPLKRENPLKFLEIKILLNLQIALTGTKGESLSCTIWKLMYLCQMGIKLLNKKKTTHSFM